MLRKIGRSSCLARASASAPHGYQSTGLWTCCRGDGLVSGARWVVGGPCWLLDDFAGGNGTPPVRIGVEVRDDQGKSAALVPLPHPVRVESPLGCPGGIRRGIGCPAVSAVGRAQRRVLGRPNPRIQLVTITRSSAFAAE